MSIITLTLNPALDLNLFISQIKPATINMVDYAQFEAAGKGINVAKILASLDINVIATGFLGQENQSIFEKTFAQKKIIDHFVRVSGYNRTNIKLLEDHEKTTQIHMQSFEVTAMDIQLLEEKLFGLASHADYIVIAGSLPTGFDSLILYDWMLRLKMAGKKVILDSSGFAFDTCINAEPFLIKPNWEECNAYVGYELAEVELIELARSFIKAKGITHIVISMGEYGAMWVNRHKIISARPPKVSVVSTVGAGDSMVAGIVYGLSQSWEISQILRYATAISAHTVTQADVSIDASQSWQNISTQVQISEF